MLKAGVLFILFYLLIFIQDKNVSIYNMYKSHKDKTEILVCPVCR